MGRPNSLWEMTAILFIVGNLSPIERSSHYRKNYSEILQSLKPQNPQGNSIAFSKFSKSPPKKGFLKLDYYVCRD